MIDTGLEPAVGRVLVTGDGSVWTIIDVHPNGQLKLEDPMPTKFRVTDSALFDPKKGEWIAPDLLMVQTWARLMGVTLR